MIARTRSFLPLAVAASLAGVGAVLLAQLEPGDRGIAPIDSSSSYEVTGVAVDVAARNADSARTLGWREAQRKGWKSLYARLHGVPLAEAPGLPDGTLDGIVAGIVVEDEQVSPNRYIARLGVLFDRTRAGALLGVHGSVVRSPPMLVIPTVYSGGALTSLELRNPWQAAWARFRTGSTPLDYVRPRGSGADPLLLNVEQTRRPGRRWWRMLLEQYGASDVVMPQVALRRLYPGGPVVGRFVARHGPDGEVVGGFELIAENAAALPAMLDEGVRRIDFLYAQALREGRLAPDPSLVEEAPAPAELDEALDDAPVEEGAAPVEAAGQAYVVQVETSDAAAVNAAEAALRGVPGASGVDTQSLALGGVSVIRMTYDGDVESLRLALGARGWSAEGGGTTLRMRRAGAAASTPGP